jgi:site-specific DNA-methyltransferase (adenine-specific)
MRTLDDSSVDSIVTDPPYELGFMGKAWDASGVAFRVEVWREALRVLKPGGHLLAFSGSRTYHRMAVAIEDAGFEIRDQIMWVYGSGFPKSLDVSKAIDAAAGAEREVLGYSRNARPNRVGKETKLSGPQTIGGEITAPATPEAARWQGWGTALKPAHEPICVARKPLRGTVAQNVLAHGTGALNIDGCRVACDWLNESSVRQGHSKKTCSSNGVTGWNGGQMHAEPNSLGRWPANLIHDGSEEAVGMFPQQTSGGTPAKRGGMGYHGAKGQASCNTQRGADSGSAARFFYSAKASKRDRDEGMEGWEEVRVFGDGGASLDGISATRTGRANYHPTVKPTDLMRYLVRLVTPPGGLVLDPFTGSGSTGKGAVLEGFRFLGIELSPEYTEIARARIRHAVGHVAPEPVTEAQVPDALPGQLRLFA